MKPRIYRRMCIWHCQTGRVVGLGFTASDAWLDWWAQVRKTWTNA